MEEMNSELDAITKAWTVVAQEMKERHGRMVEGLIPPDSFIDLKHWLDNLPNQIEGIQGSHTAEGNAYVEFTASALSRCADIRDVEAAVARQMQHKLQAYFAGRGDNPILWRKHLEWDLNSGYTVIRYGEDGPDRELSTNRQCFMDKNWLWITAYARCYCGKAATN